MLCPPLSLRIIIAKSPRFLGSLVKLNDAPLRLSFSCSHFAPSTVRTGPVLAKEPSADPRMLLRPLPGLQPDSSVLLPNQWSLRPAGEQVELGNFPVNVAIHPQGQFAAVLHSGYGPNIVAVVDLETSRSCQTSRCRRRSTASALPPAENKCWSAAAKTSRLQFHFADGKLSDPKSSNSPQKTALVTAGMACSRDGKWLYVACCLGNGWRPSLATSGASSNRSPCRPKAIPIPSCLRRRPIGCTSASGGGGGGRGRSPANGSRPRGPPRRIRPKWSFRRTRTCSTWPAPTATRLRDRHHDGGRSRSSPRRSIPRPGWQHAQQPGPGPQRQNTVGGQRRCEQPGRDRRLPPRPEPCAGVYSRRLVSDQRADDARGRPDPRGQRQGAELEGQSPGSESDAEEAEEEDRVHRRPFPRGIERHRHAQARRNAGLDQGGLCLQPAEGRCLAHRPRPRAQQSRSRPRSASPVRSSIASISSRRTAPTTRSSATCARATAIRRSASFPEHVTPNQHALARQFVLLDNFYVDGEVSANGHEWSMAAYATDYVEKVWPLVYRHGGEHSKRVRRAASSIRPKAPRPSPCPPAAISGTAAARPA